MDNRSVKQRICKLREEKGVSQKWMADRLGIDRNTYREIEAGKTEIIYKRLPEIAVLLGVSLEALFREDDAGERLEEAKAEYGKQMKRLTDSYDLKLRDLEKELSSKNEIIDILKKQIRDKEDIITLLRKNSR